MLVKKNFCKEIIQSLWIVRKARKRRSRTKAKEIQEASGVPNGSLKAQRRRPPAIDAMA